MKNGEKLIIVILSIIIIIIISQIIRNYNLPFFERMSYDSILLIILCIIGIIIKEIFSKSKKIEVQ
jgi:hypothetical protein